MKRVLSRIFALILCLAVLLSSATPAFAASGSLSGISAFTVTDVRGGNSIFNAGGGKPGIIIMGYVTSCGNTQNSLSNLSYLVDYMDTSEVGLYCFDISSASNSSIASYLNSVPISTAVHTAGKSSSAGISSVYNACINAAVSAGTISGSFSLPLIAYYNSVGTITKTTAGPASLNDMVNNLRAAGTDVDYDTSMQTLNITGMHYYDMAYEILALINETRSELGLSTLTMDSDLLKAAMQRAAECAIYYDHTRPDLSPCFSLSPKMRSENIAMGQTSAAQVMNSWINSPGHYANITDPDARCVGVGVFKINGYYTWVQCFGYNTSSNAPKPANANATYKIEVNDYVEEVYAAPDLFSLKTNEAVQISLYQPNLYFDTPINIDTYSWNSSDSSIAAVDANGKITAKGAGTATITGTNKTKTSAKITLTVVVTGSTTTATSKPTTTTTTKKTTTTTTSKPTTTTTTKKTTTTTTSKPTTTTTKKTTTTTTAKPTTTTTTKKTTTTTTAKPTTTTTTKKTTTTTTSKPTTTTTTKKTTTTTSKPTTTTTTKKTTTTTSKPTTTTTTKKTTTTTGQGGIVSVEIIRLAGKGRCETAVEISREGYTKAVNVVIASGDTYADALVGVPLAYALDAPILLVRNHTLDEGTLDEIKRLGAKNIYILGGEFAVGKNVASQLKNAGYQVSRICGEDRFGTSLEIAKKLRSISGKPSEIFFVFSHNYPDALAVSGIAAAKGCPVIYVSAKGTFASDDASAADVAEFIRSCGAKKATIISGPLVVSENAETNINSAGISTTKRIYGKNRYETCIEINKAYSTILKGKSICVATGENYPDALAGGVFAALNKAPLLLVGSSTTDKQYDYFNSRKPAKVYIFGGTGVVADELINDLTGKETPVTTTKATTTISRITTSSVGNNSYYIYSDTIVYRANSSSSIFHRSSNCSNMGNPRSLTYSKAKAAGLRPCSKCCSNCIFI